MIATQETAVSAVKFAAYVLSRCSFERRKATDDDIRRIRVLYASGTISQFSLGLMFGLTQTSISDIVRRKTYRHVTP